MKEPTALLIFKLICLVQVKSSSKVMPRFFAILTLSKERKKERKYALYLEINYT